jgi:hypothetical protein
MIWIEGASAQQRNLIIEGCERVFELVPTDETLRVEISDQPGLDPNITLRTDRQRIWIQSRGLQQWPVFYVQFLIYEEAAHFAIGHRGLPQGGFSGLAAFFQELFAGHVQYLLFARHNPADLDKISFFPVEPDGHAYYTAGKHIGLALAGASKSDDLLAQMLEDFRFDPRLQELTREMRYSLRAGSVLELAEDVVTAYERLSAE